MKKKIYLHLKDYRDSFNEPHIKRPYYLYLGSGYNSIYFSNKKQAKAWITKFENRITEHLVDLIDHSSKLFNLNTTMIPYMDFVRLKKFRDALNYPLNRASDMFNFSKSKQYNIGRELDVFQIEIEAQYKSYLQYLRKNNRFNYLYQQTRKDYQSFKRLCTEIDILLNDTKGMIPLRDIIDTATVKEFYLQVV